LRNLRRIYGPANGAPAPRSGYRHSLSRRRPEVRRESELEDGWVLHWYTTGPDDFLAFCPYHANGLEVPRAQGSIDIGDVTVDLQEFDYVLDRPNITHFKHISTRRYLNLRLENDRVTAGELLNGRWSHTRWPKALRVRDRRTSRGTACSRHARLHSRWARDDRTAEVGPAVLGCCL